MATLSLIEILSFDDYMSESEVWVEEKPTIGYMIAFYKFS